jgi:hypothetical protein
MCMYDDISFMINVTYHNKRIMSSGMIHMHPNYFYVKQSRYRPGVAQRVPGN